MREKGKEGGKGRRGREELKNTDPLLGMRNKQQQISTSIVISASFYYLTKTMESVVSLLLNAGKKKKKKKKKKKNTLEPKHESPMIPVPVIM